MNSDWLLNITDVLTGDTLQLWLSPETAPADLGILWLMDPVTRQVLDPSLPSGLLECPFGTHLLALLD